MMIYHITKMASKFVVVGKIEGTKGMKYFGKFNSSEEANLFITDRIWDKVFEDMGGDL